MAKVIDTAANPFERAVVAGLLNGKPKGRGGTREGGGYPLEKPRVGKEIMAARLQELTNALLDGAAVPGSDMVLFIRQREGDETSAFYIDGRCPPLSYGQARRMIRTAEQSIAGMVEKDREQLLAEHIAKRRRLYQSAVTQGNLRTALQILDSEANLLGLFPEKSILSAASGGVNLQILVQAVIAAETKTLEAVTPVLIEGKSNGDGNQETERKFRDEAVVVGSQTLP